MQSLWRCCLALGLLLLGYAFGASGILHPATAQEQQPQFDEQTEARLQEVYNALNTAMLELQRQNLYQPAIQGVNSFAVSVGGLDVMADLENRQVVDPETFAGLYADLATDEVAEFLDRDEQGRLTYKGKVVRMYPISRLKQLFNQRETLGQTQ